MPLNFFKKTFSRPQPYDEPAPPEWAPAPEISHQYGLNHEADEDDFRNALAFCEATKLEAPRLLSTNVIERINAVGCRVWGLEIPHIDRFKGIIRNPEDAKDGSGLVYVETSQWCGDACLLSNLPLFAAMYERKGKVGFYYEVTVLEIEPENGVVAIGTACRPYPEYRLPGWNRQSSGLHLDDMRKFFEDSEGGRDYLPPGSSIEVCPGDIFGCGFIFQTGTLFFTYNGQKLPDAFMGIHLSSDVLDVYAAVGVSGAVKIQVNFGGDLFRWPAGNEWAWRTEGHVGGKIATFAGANDDDLPTYQEIGSSFQRQR